MLLHLVLLGGAVFTSSLLGGVVILRLLSFVFLHLLWVVSFPSFVGGAAFSSSLCEVLPFLLST